MTEGEQVRKGKGTIFVTGEVCKGCSFCIDFCPTHCIEFSHEFNRKGYHYPVLSKPEDCTGCDLCGSTVLTSRSSGSASRTWRSKGRPWSR